MNNIIKYLAFIFLTCNLLFGIESLNHLAENSFLIIIGLSFFISIYSLKILKNVIFNKSFQLFFILNLLNLIYYLCFEFGDIDSFKYLSARFVQFSIFSITIYSLKNDFPKILIKFLKFVTTSALLFSLILKFPDLESRYSGIFINPNQFSILMVIGFALILFNEKKSILNYSLLFLFLSTVVISGSRAAIVGLFIAIFSYVIHYKLKNLFNVALILSLLFIFSLIGGENNGMKRIFELDFLNRKYEYIYAIETLMQKPFFGYGLKNYAYIDFSLIQFDDVQINYGAHNAYLAILVQYGIFFATIFFSVFFYFLIKIYSVKIEFFGDNVPQTRFLFFITTYALVNGLFENTIVGINFIQTNLFWLVVAYLTHFLHTKNESNSISN
ncbi:MAG: hypothetical protein CMP55_04610 [Flavobacteriales bacterium]|nr:hypothetical protein [Flavobacteriales bacterium]